MPSHAEIVVYGKAEPAGSKRGFAMPTGQVRIVDANPKARDWKNLVALAAAEHWAGADLLDGPLRLTATFYQPRPKGHFGTGRNAGILKAGAPPFPDKKPDATKLTRGIEDAMTGIIYRDDSQIVEQHIYKVYGTPARAELIIEPVLLGGDGPIVDPNQLALMEDAA